MLGATLGLALVLVGFPGLGANQVEGLSGSRHILGCLFACDHFGWAMTGMAFPVPASMINYLSAASVSVHEFGKHTKTQRVRS